MKNYLSIKCFVFVVLTCLSANTFAQVTCEPNMDFGLGNFSSWTYFEGTYISSGGTNPGVLVDNMQVFPPSAQTNKRFTITNGVTTDFYGGFPIADPTKTYSLKIGFDTQNYCVNKARYQVHVPAGVNDYALIYRYAIVMEDPGHIASQQPKFVVTSIDSATGIPLPCGNFTYVAGSLPGFTLSNQGSMVFYKSWSTASLNLSGYAGQTITVEFETFDCALGGHWGYSYIDMTCGLFEITLNDCSYGGNTTLSAPPGFDTYTWYDSTYSTVIGSGDTTTFSTPNSSKSYHVVCTPFSGYGCPDTFTTRIIISNLSINASNDTTICNGSSISLSSGANGGVTPLSYTWTPATNLSCTSCSSTTANPSATTKYFIRVNDSTGCGRTDSVNVTVTPTINPSVTIAAYPGTTICAGNLDSFVATPVNGGPSPSYQWLKNNLPVGSNNPFYVDNGLNDNDIITCVLTSSAACALPVSAVSNALTITVHPSPAQPAAFTTSSPIAYDGQIGVVYTIPNVPGITYTWSYSGTGATINGSGNSVTLDFSTMATSGNLCVTATTIFSCGPSASRCIPVTVLPYETWTCGTGNDWNDPANWDGGFVPYGTISVLIPAGTPCNPNVCTTPANVYNMTVNAGATVNICCPNNINVNSNLTLNGSVLGCGYLTMTGSSCHTVYGNGIVANFELNNSCGGIINPGDTLHIVDTYLPTLGVMTVSGGLELLSDSTTTAVILAHPGPGPCTNYINGDVICDKYIHGGRRAFRFLGHPYTSSIPLSQLTPYIDITGQGGAVNGFTPTFTNNPSAFWYNTLTGNGSAIDDSTGWIPFTNTNGIGVNAWNRFEGLRIFIRGILGQGLNCGLCIPNPVTIKTHGPLNECDETVTCTTNGNLGYNFISNPYPCNIDLSQCTRDASIGANFTVWDPNQGLVGAYVDQPFSFSYILPSLSAFITTCTANINNTITFHESDKTGSAASGNLFKTTSGFGNNVIQLRIVSNNNSLSWDRLLLFFNNQSLSVTDPLDAQKLSNPDLDFYTFSTDANKLSIDVRPYTDGQVIQLGLQTNSLQDYAVRVDDYNIPAGNYVYLHDKYLNQLQPLNQGMQYNFSVSSDPASQGDNRFELNLSNAPLNVSNIVSGNFKVSIIPNPAKDDVAISFEATEPGNASIKISNMLGQEVYANVIGEQQKGNVIVPVHQLATGVYMVTIKCGNHTKTERLVKE